MFNLTANVLFDQDGLLLGGPEGAYRVTHSIIALIMRVGEGALAAERAVGKVLHGKAHTVSSIHLFDQDDLPQDTLGGAYRVARSIVALIMCMGEGASATERAAGSRYGSP